MADQKYSYRLEQKSPSGRPGFESFKSAEDGLYYFHFNNEKGQPLLFSPAYPTAKERTAKRNVVRKRMLERDAYKKSGNKKSFYFTLFSAKGIELARSSGFTKRKERDAAIEVLISGPSATITQTPSSKEQDQPEASKRAISNSKDETGSHKSVLPSRFRYNLIFRLMEEGQPLVGEIEYPILKKRATFQGLDNKAIMAFITQHLPKDTWEDAKLFQKEKELALEIEQAQKREEALTAKLAETKRNEKALTKELEDLVAKKSAQAKATEEALLKKMERLKAKEKERIQGLSVAHASEIETVQKQVEELKNKIDLLLAKEKELNQQLSSTRAQLKKESNIKEELEKELTAIEKESEEEPKTDQKAATEVVSMGTLAEEKGKLQQGTKVTLPLFLLLDGRLVGKTVNLKKNRFAVLRMQVENEEEQNALESYKANVLIKSLESNRLLSHIKNYYGTISMDKKYVIVPIALKVLSPGGYHLSMSVTSVHPPYHLSSPTYEGHIIIQVQ